MDIIRLFSLIDDESYVVIRNANNILTDFNTNEDIDLLCEDKSSIIHKLNLKKRHKRDTGVHYYCEYDGSNIKIDLWGVDSGYYDLKWGKEILNNRVKNTEGFFVPDELNLYYSLLYHVVVQKKELPIKYKELIIRLGIQLGIRIREYNRKELIDILESFMKEKGYKYTLNDYSLAVMNFKGTDSEIREKNIFKMIRIIVAKSTNVIKAKIIRIRKKLK